MNKVFFRTNNYNRMVAAVTALVKRDPSLPGLGLIYGKWGFGKSEAVDYYYSVEDIFYIAVERLWRPRRLLEEMCEVMNLGDPVYRLDRLSDQVCDGLRRWNKPLFIDEGDYLLKNGVMLDVIRDIHEKTRVPIIMIGMESALKKLHRHGQFLSRILPAGIVEFMPVTPPEIRLIINKWTGLTMEINAAELFCQYTDGDFRYIVGYLLSMEESCNTMNTKTIDAKMVESVVNRMSGRKQVKIKQRIIK